MVDKDKGPIRGFAKKRNPKTGEYYSYPVYGEPPIPMTEKYTAELNRLIGGRRYEDLPPYEKARANAYMERIAREIRAEQAAAARDVSIQKRAMATSADLQRNREVIEARRAREQVESVRPKSVRTKLRYNESLRRWELVQE